MSMTNRNQRRLFYVVQFIELPFKDIDDYVCVPYSWTIQQKPSDLKVVITYPSNEDPFDTRDRVKRRERPNDEWRFYLALVKYKSDIYKDAECWIAKRKYFGPGEGESEIKDTKPEPKPNKKLRSASQPFWSGPNSDKPQLTVKPHKNPRKPLPRLLIRRPLSQKPDKNLDIKRLKFKRNAKRGIVTDHTIIPPGCSTQESSIIIVDNQLIQNDQTKHNSASNGEINTEQRIQPGVIKENQSAEMSVQSTSTQLLVKQKSTPKLLAEQQLSLQPTTEQQLSLQPPTDQQTSSKLTVEQQPSSKLTVEQQPSPKLPTEQQPLPVCQDYQETLDISVIDLDESVEHSKSCQKVMAKPFKEQRPSTETRLNTLEQAPQPELMNERPTPLIRYQHSLLEPHSRDVSAGQSKELIEHPKSHLQCILTAPTTVQRPSSTPKQPFQQYGHPQLPIMPAQFPAVKKLKNPVDKKTRLEGITKNISNKQFPSNSMIHLGLTDSLPVTQTVPLTQNYLQQAQDYGSQVNNVRGSMRENFINQNVSHPQGIMNTSAVQNLSNLAHQYTPSVTAPREQQYLPIHKDCLQQFACIQDMLRRQSMAQASVASDQRVYHQNAIMNRGCVIQSQQNSINQPIQFLPQNEYQYIPINSVHAQEVIRHESMRGLTDGAYKPNVENRVNIQLAARNSSNQLHQNSQNPQQKIDPPNYQDQCTASSKNCLPLEWTRSSYIPKPQRVTKRPQSLSTSKTQSQALLDAQRSCLLQEIGIQRRVNQVNQRFTEYNNINLKAVRENLTVEPVPTTQDSEVQTMPSSDRPHETQFTLVQSNHVYQHPRTKKTIVNQTTQTDWTMDVHHCVDEIAGSPAGESASKVVDSACQTDEWLRQEQGSPYQESASDSENVTEDEIESENEVVSEANHTTLTTVQHLTPEAQQAKSKIIVEQDMLDVCGTLFTEMGATLSVTRDMFENLRNSMLVCAKSYETLLEKVDKFNSIQEIPTSPTNNVMTQVPQVNHGRPVADNDNNTGVGDAPTPIREQRGTISLPAEYDPNDTKWTLKYREKKPGLAELIPRTGVYVRKKELKRCIQESNDCRTLARLLLTEVFSKNALSVCSLTGGRAKAFNSVNIDVRPGLDEHARLVLLAFVEEYGDKCGWNTSDATAVISSIRTKIYEIRAKHGQTCKV